ncbi:hypothetical protein BSZ05_25370 [Vibrio mediterranei]|uniref:Uncharacterized protein n=1 Tax=Vibrio mediterranei TaxID=689 RepID=A0AAN1FMF8_9VIBR|nr:hypothetical protein BSZ05_25370 [Vibrio mediterranei]
MEELDRIFKNERIKKIGEVYYIYHASFLGRVKVERVNGTYIVKPDSLIFILIFVLSILLLFFTLDSGGKSMIAPITMLSSSTIGLISSEIRACYVKIMISHNVSE